MFSSFHEKEFKYYMFGVVVGGIGTIIIQKAWSQYNKSKNDIAKGIIYMCDNQDTTVFDDYEKYKKLIKLVPQDVTIKLILHLIV